MNQTSVSGSLPSEWGANTSANKLGLSLQELYLHQTQLSGEVPGSWLMGLPNVTRFTIWHTDVCGLHPEGGIGLGSLCLDTTGTRLGTNCTQQRMGPITNRQAPVACVSQFPVIQYPGCSAISCSESPAECCASLDDRVHLLQVKAAWGSPAFLSSWDQFAAPCGSPRWEWIECDWQGRVSRLNLTGMGLYGMLPANIFMLSRLEVLDLSRNSLAGVLQVAQLNLYLRVVDLSDNMLAGPLPDSWSQLTSLKSLDLSNNPIGVSSRDTLLPCQSQP